MLIYTIATYVLLGAFLVLGLELQAFWLIKAVLVALAAFTTFLAFMLVGSSVKANADDRGRYADEDDDDSAEDVLVDPNGDGGKGFYYRGG